MSPRDSRPVGNHGKAVSGVANGYFQLNPIRTRKCKVNPFEGINNGNVKSGHFKVLSGQFALGK